MTMLYCGVTLSTVTLATIAAFSLTSSSKPGSTPFSRVTKVPVLSKYTKYSSPIKGTITLSFVLVYLVLYDQTSYSVRPSLALGIRVNSPVTKSKSNHECPRPTIPAILSRLISKSSWLALAWSST